jgi:eukaryotic-like serine/threonine-protein kinase
MHAITTEVPYLTRCQGPLASVIMGLLISTPQARLTSQQVRGLLTHTTTGSHTGPQTVMLGGHYPHANATMITTGPRPAARRGARRWLLAGLVAVLAAGLAGGWFGHRFLTGSDTEAANGGVMTYGADDADIPQFEVSNGYCAQTDMRKGVSYPSSSDCDQPHAVQVYGVTDIVNSSANLKVDYPGRDRLSTYGQSWCSLVFASKWVNEANKDTALTFVTLIPSQKAWGAGERDAQREIVCVLHSRDGSQLRGTKVAKN